MGPRASHTQALLNELAAAKLRLLNPLTKQQYDAALADSVSLLESRFSPELLPSPDEHHGDGDGHSSDPRRIAHSNLLEIRVEGQEGYLRPVRPRETGRLSRWILSACAAMGVLVGAAWMTLSSDPNESGGQMERAGVSGASRATVESPDSSAAGVIPQEANGDVRLAASTASPPAGGLLAGGSAEPSPPSPASGSSVGGILWRFSLKKLPSLGVFRIVVTYEAGRAPEGSQYTVLLDGKPRARDIRTLSKQPETGETLDEFHLQVTKTGEHVFEIRSSAASAGFTVKSVDLYFR